MAVESGGSEIEPDGLAETRVSVVIVNLNGRQFLEHCLPSLFSQSLRPAEVVLVDNASSDDSVAWVSRQYPSVRLVKNDRNLGFAEANNQGIRATTAPLVVTLNNDTEVTTGWLEALVRAAGSAPDVGTCASQILSAAEPDVVDSQGIFVNWTGTAWNRDLGKPATGVEETPRPVWGPSAAAALYRRSMLEEIGLFDPDFFAYYEDVDLAWRARLAGWQCLFVPGAVVFHVHSGTLGRVSPAKQYYISRNKVWTYFKDCPSPALWATLPLAIVADLAALAYQFWRAPALGMSAWRGRLDALRQIRRMLHKRRQVQQLRARREERKMAASPAAPASVHERR